MSAVRNTGNRRNHGTLPYARPQAKKSTWSISGFLSSLNPFRSTASEQNEEYEEEEDDDLEENSITPQSPADHLSKRGHEISRQMNGNGSPALGGFGSHSTPSKQNKNTNIYAFPTTTHDTQSMDISPPRPSASPAKNIEAAKEFLAGKRNLNEAEVEGLRELLANTEPEENAPFRFTSTAPLSPDRGRSPVQVGRKTLPRNPNGTYRWAGAGSARRSVSRNRYSSPAFGPSRSRSERVILRETRSEGDVVKADNKRRRVGEEADTSAASSSGATANTNGIPLRSPGPEPSPTRVQLAPAFSPVESPSKPSAARAKSPAPHTPSRLRIPQKPTAPVNPSPLRQAWSGSPGSQTDGSPSKTPPTAQKQTKAANFMTELIKEVTPAKRPDLSNPYQTASPVKPTTHSKPRVTRRTRATGKPTAPAVPAPKEKEEPEKTYSPQAIIEATLPKGSKRSRPPASLEKSTSNKANGHAQQATFSYTVEEEDGEADDEVSPKKKTRPSPEPAAPKPLSSEVDIEVMDDEEPSSFAEKPKSVTSPPPTAGSSQSSSKSAFPSFKPTFAPKEPSKLRTSYQPDSANSSPAPPSRSTLPDTLLPPASLFGTKDSAPASGPMDVDPKDAALNASVASLPTYSFTFVATVSPTPDLFNKVKSMPASSLPTFDFTRAPKAAAAPAPVKAFDFAAAGMKSANGSAVADWTCSTCMLQNPASATEKCTVCDEPKPGATSSKPKASLAPPTTSFNWGAAGIKPQANGAVWTCSTCMLQNPATATEKCTVCDAPKEAPAPKSATQGFNWAAAGMAAPSASGAEWTCNSCMLKNPASATEKCTVCDAKR